MKKRINMDLYGINRDRYTNYSHDYGLVVYQEEKSIISENLYFRLYKEFNALDKNGAKVIHEYMRGSQ